jgi:hypothetical protein
MARLCGNVLRYSKGVRKIGFSCSSRIIDSDCGVSRFHGTRNFARCPIFACPEPRLQHLLICEGTCTDSSWIDSICKEIGASRRQAISRHDVGYLQGPQTRLSKTLKRAVMTGRRKYYTISGRTEVCERRSIVRLRGA